MSNSILKTRVRRAEGPKLTNFWPCLGVVCRMLMPGLVSAVHAKHPASNENVRLGIPGWAVTRNKEKSSQTHL